MALYVIKKKKGRIEGDIYIKVKDRLTDESRKSNKI